MCDATREMHVRTYVRTESRAPMYACPRMRTAPFPAEERLAATSRTHTHGHARTHARRMPFVGSAAPTDPESPTFRGHGGVRATSACCRNTRADRAASITARAIYRRREIRAQGRAFSVGARARARETARPWIPAGNAGISPALARSLFSEGSPTPYLDRLK